MRVLTGGGKLVDGRAKRSQGSPGTPPAIGRMPVFRGLRTQAGPRGVTAEPQLPGGIASGLGGCNQRGGAKMLRRQKLMLAAGFLFTSAGRAAAPPAATAASLKLRAGPGTGFGVLTTMPPGVGVNVLGCGPDGWCRLRF